MAIQKNLSLEKVERHLWKVDKRLGQKLKKGDATMSNRTRQDNKKADKKSGITWQPWDSRQVGHVYQKCLTSLLAKQTKLVQSNHPLQQARVCKSNVLPACLFVNVLVGSMSVCWMSWHSIFLVVFRVLLLIENRVRIDVRSCFNPHEQTFSSLHPTRSVQYPTPSPPLHSNPTPHPPPPTP